MKNLNFKISFISFDLSPAIDIHSAEEGYATKVVMVTEASRGHYDLDKTWRFFWLLSAICFDNLN